MIETQDLRGWPHMIRQCTLDDITVHSEMVRNLIPEDQFGTYVHKMRECIEAGTAFTLDDDSCFIYYLNYEKCLAHGYALYGKGEPLKFTALMMGVFWKIDTNTFKLDFIPHREAFIPEYRSIITEISLRRRMRDPRRPLVIRIDELKRKLKPIAEKRGISWVE